MTKKLSEMTPTEAAMLLDGRPVGERPADETGTEEEVESVSGVGSRTDKSGTRRHTEYAGLVE